MSARLRGGLPTLVLLVCFGVLELLAFSAAARFGRLYAAPVGLRYARALTGAQAEAALEYAAGPKNGQKIAPVFWRQETAQLKGPLATASASALCFWGEAALVWPGEYTAGTAPGPFDEAGCAVSEALAWRLWGSLDPVGLALEVGGRQRTVRGVFRGEEALALAPTAPGQGGFTAVELASPALSAEQARAFAQNCGLGAPDAMVYGQGMAGLMAAAAWLPAAALAAALFFFLVRWSRTWLPAARQGLWFLALAGLALALPAVLSSAPEWLLPGRWSDFGFWSGLARQLAGQAREWFSLPPTLREVEAKGLLVRQGVLAAALALCTQRLVWAAGRSEQGRRGETMP